MSILVERVVGELDFVEGDLPTAPVRPKGGTVRVNKIPITGMYKDPYSI